MLICTFIVAAVAADRSSDLIDFYNEKLNYFDTFLSPSGVDSLLLSPENIPFESIRTLRKAWIEYTTLRGEFITSCVEVNNTIVHPHTTQALIQNQQTMISKVHSKLNELKELFDSITTNQVHGKKIEDFQAVITFSNGTKQFEVIKGKTPDNIEELLLPLLDKSKKQGNVIEKVSLTTFHDKIEYSKRIINEAIALIYDGRNENFERDTFITKCRPIFENLDILRQSSRKYSVSSPKIIPSERDILREYPKGCGGYTLVPKTKCKAFLSKSTMDQLVKLYRDEAVIGEFFDSIDRTDPSSGCKNAMKKFINRKYISWAYEVPNIKNTQMLEIAICLNSDLPDQVYIID